MRPLVLVAGAAAALWVVPSARAQTGSAVRATGISRAFNPAISVNALFLAQHSNPHAPDPDAAGHDDGGGGTLSIQEVELQLSSNIDTYAAADVIVAVEAGEVHVEEAFVTLVDLPAGLGMRAGRLLLPLGKENLLHTHALPFVDRSRAGSALLGEEGLADVGIELAWLTPLPWFSEVKALLVDGTPPPLGSPAAEHLGYAGHWRNLFELGDATTLDLGLGHLVGHDADEALTGLSAADLTVGWRPVQGGRDTSLALRVEALTGDPAGGEPSWWSSLQWQVARAWWLQARFERSGGNATGLIGWVPSEFQSLRIQVSQDQDDGTSALLQYNFTIGSHPAHRYL